MRECDAWCEVDGNRVRCDQVPPCFGKHTAEAPVNGKTVLDAEYVVIVRWSGGSDGA